MDELIGKNEPFNTFIYAMQARATIPKAEWPATIPWLETTQSCTMHVRKYNTHLKQKTGLF